MAHLYDLLMKRSLGARLGQFPWGFVSGVSSSVMACTMLQVLQQ